MLLFLVSITCNHKGTKQYNKHKQRGGCNLQNGGQKITDSGPVWVAISVAETEKCKENVCGSLRSRKVEMNNVMH